MWPPKLHPCHAGRAAIEASTFLSNFLLLLLFFMLSTLVSRVLTFISISIIVIITTGLGQLPSPNVVWCVIGASQL